MDKAAFLERVNKTDGCWLWTGARNKKRGYGYVGSRNAHCVSYELFVGPVPPGMCVCHDCDNPPCVRPAHLFLGTQGDNMRDMLNKGRKHVSPGERNPNAKLSWDDVELIRQLNAHPRATCRGQGREAGTRLGTTVLSRAFGVSRGVIDQILRGEAWRSRCRSAGQGT